MPELFLDNLFVCADVMRKRSVSVPRGVQVYVVELLIIFRVRSIHRSVVYRGDKVEVKVFQKRFVIQNFAFFAVFCRVYDFSCHAVFDFPNADIFRRDVLQYINVLEITKCF